MVARVRLPVAVVTGGASGIGRATALEFARRGNKVVIVTARGLVKAEEVARQINDDGGEAAVLCCDVSKEDEVERMVAGAVTEFGGIDFAFNNAGIGPDGATIPFAPLTEVTEEDWNRVLDTNLKGVFLCMKHELRQMRKQGHGVIVNTSSTVGVQAKPCFGGYCPAKAGIVSLSKMAALENKATGIRVNVVCPGPIRDTGMSDRPLRSMEGERTSGISGRNAGDVSAGRHGAIPGPQGSDLRAVMGAPEDVARVVVWLCSSEASFVNGSVLSVDGGLDIA
jgi:NAD(P)-dependent dehydrogenase (short-subunit alcohol dehydrogenase family)